MQKLFSDLLSFSITVKPEIERSIATFASGGGQSGDVQVYIDAYYEDLQYDPLVGDRSIIPLGMTILVLKFPEWLANEEFHNTYDAFVNKLEEQGLQSEGTSMREVKHFLNQDKPFLIREAIKKLDSIYATAKAQFEKKADKSK